MWAKKNYFRVFKKSQERFQGARSCTRWQNRIIKSFESKSNRIETEGDISLERTFERNDVTSSGGSNEGDAGSSGRSSNDEDRGTGEAREDSNDGSDNEKGKFQIYFSVRLKLFKVARGKCLRWTVQMFSANPFHPDCKAIIFSFFANFQVYFSVRLRHDCYVKFTSCSTQITMKVTL